MSHIVDALTWAPSFTFRRSMRAKRLSLRIDPERGLEVVLPNRASKKQGLLFLQSQRAWVERHYQYDDIKDKPLDLLDSITLTCIDRVITVDYVPIQSAKRITLKAHEERIVLLGQIQTDFRPCIPLVKRWLLGQAKQYLPEMLTQVSRQCHLPYRKVGVRQQKTRWGSCNQDKDIQLNYKLLMLPETVTRYVMIHELCHTVHMNHSERFWSLVATLMPDFEQYISQLKRADALFPAWLT